MVVAADDTVAIAVNPEIDAVDVGLVSLGGRVIRQVRYKTERIPTPQEFVNIVGGDRRRHAPGTGRLVPHARHGPRGAGAGARARTAACCSPRTSAGATRR